MHKAILIQHKNYFFFLNECYQENFLSDTATWEWWQDLSFHESLKKTPKLKKKNPKHHTHKRIPKNKEKWKRKSTPNTIKFCHK